MSTKGKKVYEEIKEKMQELEAQSQAAASQIYGFEQRLNNLSTEREDCYVLLATNYLPELDAKNVQNTLREVRKNVERIFTEKQEKRKNLEGLMDENRKGNQELEREIDSNTNQIDHLSQERDKILGRVSEDLQKDKDYSQKDEKAKKAEARLQQDKRRVQEVEMESERKLPAFERNNLFNYLIRNGYGTAQYQGRELKKRLDAWVAGKVKFEANKECYNFLKSMPEFMRLEVERRQEELDEIVSEMVKMERSAEEQYGLPKIVVQAEKLISRRKILVTRDKEQDEQHASYLKERGEMDGKKDPYHIQAVQRIKQYLKGEEIADLKSRAMQTKGGEDDKLVYRIEEIDREVREIKDRVKKEKSERDAVSANLGKIMKIEKEFKERGYDRSNSSFSSGFDINNLLTGYLLGRMTSDEVSGNIASSYHREEESRSHYSSSSYSSSSGYDSDSSSSFSSGGGFGGGGFSSGSGF